MIWRLPVVVVAVGFLVFGAFDGMFLSSALTKVPEGAWFTLALAFALSSIFILWRFGKENQWRAEASDRIPLSHILTSIEDQSSGEGPRNESCRSHDMRLTAAFGGAVISPIQGIGVFFDKTGGVTSMPVVFLHFLQKFQAAPTVVIFFHVRALSTPTVPLEERFIVSSFSIVSPSMPAVHRFYRITLRHGYNDAAVTHDLGRLLYEQLSGFITRQHSSSAPEPPPLTFSRPANPASASSSTPPVFPSEPGSLVAAGHAPPPDPAHYDLRLLESAYQHQVVYIVGKEQMRIREDGGLLGWSRRIALSVFVWMRENTGSRVRNMNVDVDKSVEIGFVKVV